MDFNQYQIRKRRSCSQSEGLSVELPNGKLKVIEIQNSLPLVLRPTTTNTVFKRVDENGVPTFSKMLKLSVAINGTPL